MGFYPVSDTYSALSFVAFGEFSSLSLSFLFKSGVMVLITCWGLRKSEKFRKVLSTVPDTVRTQEILLLLLFHFSHPSFPTHHIYFFDCIRS